MVGRVKKAKVRNMAADGGGVLINQREKLSRVFVFYPFEVQINSTHLHPHTPFLKFRPGKILYAYINSYRTNYS